MSAHPKQSTMEGSKQNKDNKKNVDDRNIDDLVKEIEGCGAAGGVEMTVEKRSTSKKRPATSPLERETVRRMDEGASDQLATLRTEVRDILLGARTTSDSTEFRCSQLEEMIENIEKSIEYQSTDNRELQDQNRLLMERQQILEGRLTRMEKVVNDMFEKMLTLESRQMENNIMIHGLEEEQESPYYASPESDSQLW